MEADASNMVTGGEIDSGAVDLLVRQATGGDEEAFGQVVQLYYQRVYHVINQIVHHEEDARELAQATWVKAWQRLDRYKFEAKFYTWVYRIAVNGALDFLRKRKRHPETLLDPLPDETSATLPMDHRRELADERTPRDDLHQREVQAAFETALAKLSPEHRTALTLREVEGMSYDEIAEVMKTRKGTVMSRLFYARRALQETMEKFL